MNTDEYGRNGWFTELLREPPRRSSRTNEPRVSAMFRFDWDFERKKAPRVWLMGGWMYAGAWKSRTPDEEGMKGVRKFVPIDNGNVNVSDGKWKAPTCRNILIFHGDTKIRGNLCLKRGGTISQRSADYECTYDRSNISATCETPAYLCSYASDQNFRYAFLCIRIFFTNAKCSANRLLIPSHQFVQTKMY